MISKNERYKKTLEKLFSSFSEMMQIKKDLRSVYEAVKPLENDSPALHREVFQMGDTVQSLTVLVDKLGGLIDDFKDLDLSKY